MAILGVPMLLGPILGPILGGWLIENAYVALDLPDQRADRGRLPSCYAFWALPKDEPAAVGVARRRRHAADVARAGAFLYGISSIPGEGTFLTAKVGSLPRSAS